MDRGGLTSSGSQIRRGRVGEGRNHFRPPMSASAFSRVSVESSRFGRRQQINEITRNEALKELEMLRQHDKMVIRRVTQNLLQLTHEDTMNAMSAFDFQEELARVVEDCKHRMKRVLQNRKKECRILGLKMKALSPKTQGSNGPMTPASCGKLSGINYLDGNFDGMLPDLEQADTPMTRHSATISKDRLESANRSTRPRRQDAGAQEDAAVAKAEMDRREQERLSKMDEDAKRKDRKRQEEEEKKALEQRKREEEKAAEERERQRRSEEERRAQGAREAEEKKAPDEEARIVQEKEAEEERRRLREEEQRLEKERQAEREAEEERRRLREEEQQLEKERQAKDDFDLEHEIPGEIEAFDQDFSPAKNKESKKTEPNSPTSMYDDDEDFQDENEDVDALMAEFDDVDFGGTPLPK